MRAYQFDRFGLDGLKLIETATPRAKAGEVVVEVRAISLNYRDVMVVKGLYNPKLALPATPVSDAAGTIAEVGPDVTEWKVGDRVMTHFITGWIDGPPKREHLKTTLGAPGPGFAAERVALPASALLRIPDGMSFAEASTLPIAALTAWSVLVTEAQITEAIAPQQTILTLGTGGVSVFALQLGKALGCRVIITSSSDDKLNRVREMGADHGINYRQHPNWAQSVLDITDGEGVDVTVDTAGGATLPNSLKVTRHGGLVGVLGALTGIEAEINTGHIMMKRLRVHGVFVDSKRAFENMLAYFTANNIRPVIDRTFPFDDLTGAMRHLLAGRHVGKITVEL